MPSNMSNPIRDLEDMMLSQYALYVSLSITVFKWIAENL